MATVYLAHDVRHDRKVAIKVLHDDLGQTLGAERFLAEIRTTARLQHPHILPLLDSGTVPAQGDARSILYYVMPYVDGETLRARLERSGAMAPDDAVRLATQIAAALEHAHRRGVVHRDVKPENVLIADDLPVVADFGIALAVEQSRDQRLTQTGTSLGTPAYMSPEQITGEAELDGRSDQYSLACMWFEMLCGRPPYRGATAQATFVEHMVAPIPSLSAARAPVSTSVAAAIRQGLEKDPANRFATVAEFAAGLTSPGTAPARASAAATDNSIIVLPFENVSADAENEYFADGLTDELITDLSKVGALRVIARSSARALKGDTRPRSALGRELNVR